MKKSLFSILATYMPLETVTPEENYSTELLVKRRDILRVNRRIHLRVSADECSYIFEKDILRVSSENRLNEALG